MSETARIREAARGLSRLRPEDNRSGSLVASSKPSAIEMAGKYRELAQRAAMDLQRRIRGLEGLFGEDVARPLDAAAEELREMFYASIEMHELAHHTRDQYVQTLRTQHAAAVDDYRRQRDEMRRLLFEALDDHEARQRRTPPARRKTPEWADTARLLDDRAPF